MPALAGVLHERFYSLQARYVMADISDTTGQEFYSGSWESIRDLCRVLKIGPGKLSKVSQELVNFYQEMVDREIDGALQQYYQTPLRGYNVWMPAKSETVCVFPGAVRALARYWTAGLLLTTEFQGLDPNTNEAAQNYITESKQKLFEMTRFTRRIPGQKWRHNVRTAPPTMMPGIDPELNT